MNQMLLKRNSLIPKIRRIINIMTEKDIEDFKRFKQSQTPLNIETANIFNTTYKVLSDKFEDMFLLGQASIINMLNDFFKEHNTISKDYFNDITYGVDEKLKDYIKKLGKE
jgi:hypothetical protein